MEHQVGTPGRNRCPSERGELEAAQNGTPGALWDCLRFLDLDDFRFKMVLGWVYNDLEWF